MEYLLGAVPVVFSVFGVFLSRYVRRRQLVTISNVELDFLEVQDAVAARLETIAPELGSDQLDGLDSAITAALGLAAR